MADVFKNFVRAFCAAGQEIKAVQIDNGKLVSSEIDTVCFELGIHICRTAPYTSAHNGRVECLHRSLMACSCTMHVGAGIPENRWDELYCTACYLYNRTPSSSTPSGVTPYKLFYGHPPVVSHLCEIGC